MNGEAPAIPAGGATAAGGAGRLLLHTCCAPWSVACVGSLRAEGIGPVAFWYNPSIHPFTGYRMRRKTRRR